MQENRWQSTDFPRLPTLRIRHRSSAAIRDRPPAPPGSCACDRSRVCVYLGARRSEHNVVLTGCGTGNKWLYIRSMIPGETIQETVRQMGWPVQIGYPPPNRCARQTCLFCRSVDAVPLCYSCGKDVLATGPVYYLVEIEQTDMCNETRSEIMCSTFRFLCGEHLVQGR